jgi:hypothetical protein
VSLQTATTAQGGEVLLSGVLDEYKAAALHMRARMVCPGHSNPGHDLVDIIFSDGVLEQLSQTRYPRDFPFGNQKGRRKESHITF